MIIRVLDEGRFDVPDLEALALQRLYDDLVAAVRDGDEEGFRTALDQLLRAVRRHGIALPPSASAPFDLLLPNEDDSLVDARVALEIGPLLRYSAITA